MPTSGERPSTRRIALFIALASLFQAMETVLASPLPWFRLGLANALVLSAMVLYGFGPGMRVALGKVLLGSLITGKLFTPGFFLAFGGTLASSFAMGAALPLPFGFMGLSVLGAAAHSAAEIAIARYAVLATPAVWALMPVVGLVSVASGILTGLAAAWLTRVAAETEEKRIPEIQNDTGGL